MDHPFFMLLKSLIIDANGAIPEDRIKELIEKYGVAIINSLKSK